jgi:pimeloyl-ACP methyl ester carboxylesterase
MDHTVVRGGLTLAARDFGGSGPAVVLLHAAGRNLVDCAPLADELTKQFRVIALDLRNHGLSGDADWNFHEVVDDVDAVIRHFDMDHPAIIGHSLGGMVAAMYATAYPDQTLAAVNLDGHGLGTADQYLGIAPAVYAQRRAQLKLAVAQASIRPAMTRERVGEARAASEQQAAALNIPIGLAREAFDRSIAELPDGTFQIRPLAQAVNQMTTEIESLNLLDLWERTPRPLLLYNATKPDAWMLAAPPEMNWLPEFIAAYRAGLERDLAALAERKPTIQLINLPATHALIFEQPQLIGEQITRFLSGL